jgi:hypothetical protein
VRDGTVRIVEPANGAAVDPAFAVSFETAATSSRSRSPSTGRSREGRRLRVPIDVTAEVGKHIVELHGMAADGSILGEHAIAVHVVEPGPWVAIGSPPDGSEVVNPVMFALSASPDVQSIELFADGWSLGTVPSSSGTIAYTFAGLGYPREIVAEASANGTVVATDAIEITGGVGRDDAAERRPRRARASAARGVPDGWNERLLVADQLGLARNDARHLVPGRARRGGGSVRALLLRRAHVGGVHARVPGSRSRLGGDGTLNGPDGRRPRGVPDRLVRARASRRGRLGRARGYGIGWRVASFAT